MTTITVVSGGKSVTGELVVEHELAWQIAVNGAVEVYQKSEYTLKPRGFEDIFASFGIH